jgi:type IV pilus assembly protein PilQ
MTLSDVSAGKTTLRVQTSGKPNWSARVGEGGGKLVIDLADADLDPKTATALTKGNSVVGGVLLQAFKQESGTLTRVSVALSHTAEYRIVAEANALVVELTEAAETRAQGAAPSATRAAVTDSATVGTVSVSAVKFDHHASQDKITIEASQLPVVSETTSRDRYTLELRDAKLPDSLQKKLDTSAFGGPVSAVSTYRRKSDPSRVVVEIDKAADAGVALRKEGTKLVLVVTPASAHPMLTGVAADGGAARRAKVVAREVDLLAATEQSSFAPAAGAREQVSDPDQADAFLPGGAGQAGKRFTGRRIDIDLKDADIHNVLRFLADVGRINIVTADNVSGTVTIKMRDVPWDQALETVLQAKGLGMVRTGNMVRVAPLADLNKERELAIARRKADLQLAPLETRLIPVSYAEAEELMQRSKDLLSPRGTIAVDERTNVLITRDVAATSTRSKSWFAPSIRRPRRCSSRRASWKPRAATSETWASSGAAMRSSARPRATPRGSRSLRRWA